MKKLLPIIAVFLYTTMAGLKAQGDAGLWAAGGLSSSRMDDMKYLQEYYLQKYPLGGKIISSFPPYTLLGVGAFKQLYPSLRVGAGYYYSSSGSRSNYSDFSGSITTEMSAISHRLGLNAAYMITENGLLELNLTGRAEANYTTMDITTIVQVYHIIEPSTRYYQSYSVSGAAGLEALVHLSVFSIGIEGGYEVNLPGKLSMREYGSELLDPLDQDRVLTSDWTGWYAQFKVLYWLD